MSRCFGDGDPLYERYHDTEWGFPVADERALFELLSLEAFQAGLSWRTILGKREAFRTAFANFDADAVAGFGAADVERLLGDAGIVRNRAKIEATIGNARAILQLRAAGRTLLDSSNRIRWPRDANRRWRGARSRRRRPRPKLLRANSKASAFGSSAPQRFTR